MNAHRVIVLGVVAAAALGAALWSSRTQRPEAPLSSQPTVPGLEAGINDVNEVRIRTAGDAVQATIRRVDDAWVVVERDGWPANVDTLRQYLLKLARAKRVEAKTSSPALYEKIGVEDVAVATASGVQVEIDGLKQPVKLIVGRNVVRGSGSYVRDAGQAQSWQTDTDLAPEKITANWLQRDLVDLAAGRVQRVELTPASGAKVEIARAPAGSNGDFVIANLPKGREAASEYVGDATAGFLAGLRFDDVLPGKDHAPPDAGVTRAEFRSEDGIVVSVTAWKDGDKSNAQFLASLDEAVAATFAEQAQLKAAKEYEAAQAAKTATPTPDAAAPTPAEDAGEPAATEPASVQEEAAPLAVTDAAKDREQRLAALRAEVEAMNARFQGKTFVLPAFKAGNLHKALEDFLKPKG